jgi:hypothetical protein
VFEHAGGYLWACEHPRTTFGWWAVLGTLADEFGIKHVSVDRWESVPVYTKRVTHKLPPFQSLLEALASEVCSVAERLVR